ncbi:MAG: hypothetical protein J6A19_08220 [Oscillospiraceae bacterium]|nr:hypothetical protein [Oscillospiraceae bacterium]
MKKKISVVLVALCAFFLMGLSAFAVTPAYDSSVTGSKALTADECIAWLISQDSEGTLTEEALNAGYTWAVFEGKNYVTATLNSSDSGFGYQFFYDDSGTFTVDMYSGSSVSRIAGNPSSSGGSTGGSDSGSGKDISGIISDVGTGVKGVFDMSQSGFNFITGNLICMLMVSVTLAGVGIGLIARAFKTARK